MSQVGKPAPPRPRRPEALSSSITSLGLHLEERLLEACVAVAGDVLVDVLGVDHAAVAQDDAELLLVEIDVLDLDGCRGAFASFLYRRRLTSRPLTTCSAMISLASSGLTST